MIDAFVIPAYQFVIPAKPVLSEACPERQSNGSKERKSKSYKKSKIPLLFPTIPTIIHKTSDF